MNAVEKNGQPSMEEILASIRRIIAEEPNGTSPVIDLRAKPKPVLITSLIDEQADFELPAIFRPNAHPTEKHTPLFGRLTDAIRNASGGATDTRPVKPTDLQGSEDLEPAPHSKLNGQSLNGHNLNGHSHGQGHGHRNGSDPFAILPEPALSQLNLARDEVMAAHSYVNPHADTGAGHLNGHVQPLVAEPMAPAVTEVPSITGAVSEWWNAATQPAVKAAPAEDVKREMVPFRDMRMSKMGGPSGPVAYTAPEPVAQEPVAPEAPPVSEYAHTVFVHMDVPDVFQSEPVLAMAPPMRAAVSPLSHPVAPKVQASAYGDRLPFEVASEMLREPPALPPQPQTSAAASGGGVEDATADLLRPMLRQWLAENMPRMVEKALHIEIAESVKTGKKPGAH